MNKIIIISLIVVSLLIGMNFLIVNNAPVKTPQLKLNQNIIKPDNAIPSKYNFSFLKNGDYNLSYIIVANQSVWFYNTLKPMVQGVNLKTGKYYNYSMPDGIINNEIQLFIPSNYIYFVNSSNLEINYINLSTMKVTQFGAFEKTLNYPQQYYFSNFGISTLLNACADRNTGSEDKQVQWTNFQTIYTYETGSYTILNHVPVISTNAYINYCAGDVETHGFLIAPTPGGTGGGFLNYGNLMYVGNNIFNENTTYFNSTSSVFTTGAKLYNLSNYYKTNEIVPIANMKIYGNLTLSNLVFNSKGVKNFILIKPLLINTLTFNGNYYMNTNYDIMRITANHLTVNSYNSTGAAIKNNFILNNVTLVTSNFSKIINVSSVSILPLNYSNYLWKSGYIYVHFTKTNNINYYNISINYSVIQVFKNPYNLNNFIFPISILFLFVFAGIFIYLKFNYGD